MASFKDFLIDIKNNAYGLGENAASLLTGAIAQPVSGYAAMFDPVHGAEAIKQGMTYAPRTEAGKMYQQAAARTLGEAVKPVMPIIDTWQQGVDIAGRYSPIFGALLQTTPTALGVALGAKPALKTGRAIQNNIVRNFNTPKNLNTGYRGQRGAVAAQRPLTEFEQNHLTAQKNASLPVSQGGLGLPPNNTAMDRARALGFDVDNPVYHGTGADIKEFDLSRSGSASGAEQYGIGVYTTTNPTLASGYANSTVKNANVLPLLTRITNPISDETAKKLTRAQIKKILEHSPNLDDNLWNYGDVGYDGKNKVLNDAVNSLYDYQGDKMLENLHPIANDFFKNNPVEFNNAAAKVLKKDGVIVDFPKYNEKFNIPWNANQVRSRFAAFDPMKRDSANLLASMPPLIGATTLGAYLYNEDKKNKNKKD